MTTANHKIRLVMDLRRAGVADTRVLAAMERTPRESFCAPQFLDRAYEDTALPIAHGQTLSQPTVVGLMTQAIEPGPRHKVLEVGTGSGYQAAVLAQLCRRLYTVERHRPLLQDAEKRLGALGIRNVVTRHGDGWRGWPEQAPFDRIIVTAAPGDVPAALVDQLAEGGIMVIPVVRDRREQTLVRIRKQAGSVAIEDLASVRFVPMVQGLATDGDAQSDPGSSIRHSA